MAIAPFVVITAFCERVLQEQDGVISAIRFVDRFVLERENEVTKLPDGAVLLPNVTLLVSLKSGDYVGKGTLAIVGFTPSGAPIGSPQGVQTELECKGGESGNNVVTLLRLGVKESGTYWFEIRFNDEILTRTPLYVSLFPTQKTTLDHAAAPPGTTPS